MAKSLPSPCFERGLPAAVTMHVRQIQVAIASLKEDVENLGVRDWRALRECRRGLGALLAHIEGRTQG